MSRQIQIRRGTAAEHENFTGAVGEITMDTTNKTIRVHDGTTAGGVPLAKQSEIPEIANADYVVESQLPTAENNYTWYRKYKSGWVEQGGLLNDTTGDSGTVTLIVEMASANYNVFIMAYNSGGYPLLYKDRTTTSFNYSGNIGKDSWEVKGFAA